MRKRRFSAPPERLHFSVHITFPKKNVATVYGPQATSVMAKGLRSSRNKTNNSKLRSIVFGPVENARKVRLSAKLLELATKPKPREDEDTGMDVEEKGSLSLCVFSPPLSSCRQSGGMADFGML